MLNPVIVPLDGSELSEEALPLARELAIRWREPLHVVLVHESPYAFIATEADPSGLLGLDQDLRRYHTAYLERIVAGVASGDDLKVVPVLLDGPVVGTLSEYAIRLHARLVVMTTHGRGGVSRLFLGSVADRLVRHLRCPVLLARPGATLTRALGPPGARHRVVVPLDGSRFAESILDKVLAVYSPREVQLELVSVVGSAAGAGMAASAASSLAAVEENQEDAAEYLRAVQRRLRELDVPAEVKVVVGEPVAAAVLRFAEQCHADLVALATRGRVGIERAVLGSVADKVIRSCGIPVLVWNPFRDTSSHVLGKEFMREERLAPQT
jgi:nucleotide-binding universal stress UspA family protein